MTAPLAASAQDYLNRTTSLCASCKRSVPATLWRINDQVIMRKICPEHGHQEALISGNADWYAKMMTYEPRFDPPTPNREPSQGCPYDCGPCSAHQQRVHLPIVPITSACNLSCPICYTHNKNDGAYHMSAQELQGILDQLRSMAPDRRIINITGGEPTQHPDFVKLIELCKQEGVHRVTLSTHGMRFIKDEHLLPKLAELDTRVILSFDSFDDETNEAMLGGKFTKGKLRALDLLERHQINTTLLPVLALGQNDHEIGQFINLALEREFIRSVELHTMTFTGQYGVSFERQARYTTFEVLRDIEQQSQGRVRVDDFVPSPSAHPMCYLITYLIRLDDGQWVPMTRFMPPQDMRDLISHTLYMEPDERTQRKLQDIINRLWAGEIDSELDPDLVLSALKRIVNEIYAPQLSPLERMRASERSTKAIYVHAHMDEETFDTDRIQQCCVGIVNPDGTNLPSCAYNVLYRERDPRFNARHKAPISALGPGRLPHTISPDQEQP